MIINWIMILKKEGLTKIGNRNFDAYSPLHKSGHTSKGDQLKWKIDDRWYKADYMGYEGLSEVLVSDLLQKSTLSFPLLLSMKQL